MKKYLSVIILIIIFFSFLNFFPCYSQGLSDITNNLKQAGESEGAGFTYTDPRVLIGNIIKAALGLIGIVFVVIVIYGGFLWMTSKGEQDKVKEAKNWIINGAIGIAIILASYAITAFIVSALVSSSAGTQGSLSTP